MKILLTFTALLLAGSLWAAPPYERNQFSTNTPPVSAVASYQMGNLLVTNRMTATNGYSSDGVNFTRMPTNAPANGDVITATGTAGATKYAAPTGGGSQTPILQDVNYGNFGISNLNYLQGPLQIWNTDARTNGSYLDSSGIIFSNAVRAIRLANGTLYIGTNMTGTINGTNQLQIDTVAGNAFNVDTNRGVTVKGGLAVGTSIVGAAGTITSSGAINAVGAITTTSGDLISSAGGMIRFSGSTISSAPANGNWNFVNTAGTGFGTLTFGPGYTAALSQWSTNWPAFRMSATNGSWLGNPFLAIQGGTNNSKVVDMTLTGAFAATNGFASYRSNLLAAATIAVGASPFSWTNTTGLNAVVYVDGIGVTGSTAINGTTVFGSISQNTLLLGPGEYTTITYTVGTPTATWRPR